MAKTVSKRWIGDPLHIGIQFIRNNPQIWMTLVIALVIFASFLFVAHQFINVAQRAHQELAVARVGAVHNAIVAIVSVESVSDDTLNALLLEAKRSHSSFSEMFIVERTEDDQWERTVTIEPFFERDVGRYRMFYELALAEPATFTHTEMLEGSTGVTGFRSLPGERERILVTHQRFTASDALIQDSIERSILALVVVLGIIFFLLFHHARIIDYGTLYQRLKEVNQLKDDFISMASHELRSPLTAIRGYTSLIKEKEGLPEGVPDRLQKIDHAAETLNQLIEDILDVSRIDQGRLKLELQPVRIADVASEVCGLLSQKAATKGLSLRCDHIDQQLFIHVDRVRLRQVLVNLIDNAIKYTSEGTVELSVSAEKQTAVIRISDSGMGMSAEDQLGLFEKFYRVNNSEVRKQTGTGLGLWITKELIERMQGTISVESIKGIGTHMIVRFAVLEHAEVNPNASAPAVARKA